MSAGSEEFVGAHGGPRLRVVDEHMFVLEGPRWRGYEVAPRARVQLFTGAAPLSPVAVVTQLMGEGNSVMNAAESFAEEIWSRLTGQSQEPPIVVMVMLSDDEGGDNLDLSPQVAMFRRAAGRFEVVRPPMWGPFLTGEQVAELVEQPVDLARGDGYVEPVRAPEPVLRFRVDDVTRFPVPELDGDPPCMPASQWWRPGWWLERAGLRPKCFFHQGNWTVAAAAGITALRLAEQKPFEDLADDDEHDQIMLGALRVLEELDLDTWTRKVAELFFIDPIQLQDAEWPYVNGRHRTRAMKDQRVSQAVVAYLADPVTGQEI